VSAGYDHALALTKTGQLYAFGDNTNGELGRSN
jgi:alpha-tubulin suppressor-like RCC1 family protein